MVLNEKKTSSLFLNLCVIAIGVSVGVLGFEIFVRSQCLMYILRYSAINVEQLFFIMFFVFLICSCLLCGILYWLFWESKAAKDFYKKYFSVMVAPDYYKGYKRPKYQQLFQNILTRDPDQKIDPQDAVAGRAPLGSPSNISLWPLLPVNPDINGPYKAHYPNGQLQIECTFQDGKLQGIYRTYYDDGNLHQEKYYDKGKLSGIFRAYDANGILYFETAYKDDVQHGVDKIFTERGIMRHKDIYRNGVRVNRKTFDDAGNMIFEEE